MLRFSYLLESHVKLERNVLCASFNRQNRLRPVMCNGRCPAWVTHCRSVIEIEPMLSNGNLCTARLCPLLYRLSAFENFGTTPACLVK
ncbi:hypothetical protein BLOT_003872 [Blomia tropicalis]|nr:hypothetical protein BLOT_003872 [Blomia tropicalis]